MRVANVYDIDQKTYLIKLARCADRFWHVQWALSHYAYQARWESDAAAGVWLSHACYWIWSTQEYATLWILNESMCSTYDPLYNREYIGGKVDVKYRIPYSGKFSHGAKFRVFRGLVSYRENKNREILNLHVRIYACARATERARA